MDEQETLVEGEGRASPRRQQERRGSATSGDDTSSVGTQQGSVQTSYTDLDEGPPSLVQHREEQNASLSGFTANQGVDDRSQDLLKRGGSEAVVAQRDGASGEKGGDDGMENDYHDDDDEAEEEEEEEVIAASQRVVSGATSDLTAPSITAEASEKRWASNRASLANIEEDIKQEDDDEEEKESALQEDRALQDKARLKAGPRDLVVTLMNGQEITVHCPEGHQTKAMDLAKRTLEALEVVPDYHPLFSVWVMSPALRLPAKDEHYPVKMLKLWPDLLSSYTEASDLEEFPAIYLRKAPSTHPGMEVTVSDENALLLLFIELTDEVINSECLVEHDDAIDMAATHLFLNFGDEATKKDVSESQGSQQPKHLAGGLRLKGWEREVFEAYERLLPLFKQQSSAEIMADYLERGRQYATYGGVKFSGTVEPDHKGTLLRVRRTKSVLVSVNFDGLHVVDTKRCSVLLSVPFNAFRAKAYLSYDDNVCVSVVYNVNGGDVAPANNNGNVEDADASSSSGATKVDVQETNIDDEEGGSEAPVPLHTEYNKEGLDESGPEANSTSQLSKSVAGEREQELIIWTNQADAILDAMEAFRNVRSSQPRLAQGRANAKGVIVTEIKSSGKGVARDPRLKMTMRNAYNTLNRRMASLTLRRLRRRGSADQAGPVDTT